MLIQSSKDIEIISSKVIQNNANLYVGGIFIDETSHILL